MTEKPKYATKAVAKKAAKAHGQKTLEVYCEPLGGLGLYRKVTGKEYELIHMDMLGLEGSQEKLAHQHKLEKLKAEREGRDPSSVAPPSFSDIFQVWGGDTIDFFVRLICAMSVTPDWDYENEDDRETLLSLDHIELFKLGGQLYAFMGGHGNDEEIEKRAETFREEPATEGDVSSS